MKKPKGLKNPKCEVVMDNHLTWIDATPSTAKFMWKTYALEDDKKLTPGARRLKHFLLNVVKAYFAERKKPKQKEW